MAVVWLLLMRVWRRIDAWCTLPVDPTPSDLDGDMIEDVIERRTGTNPVHLTLTVMVLSMGVRILIEMASLTPAR